MKEKLLKIIPEIKTETPRFVKIIFWSSLILSIILIGSFLLLNNQISNLNMEKKENENQLDFSEEEVKLNQEMKLISEKINDFNALVKDHTISSNFLNFLQTYSHPKVQITSLQLDAENYKAKLSAETENFETLGEQILIFKQTNLINNLEISDIKLNEEGKVNFSLSFDFLKQIIKL